MSDKTMIEVWTKGMGGKPGLKVWVGYVVSVPREGELVVVFDGWAAQAVLDVYHDLTEEVVMVEIAPDRTGEYAAQLKEQTK